MTMRVPVEQAKDQWNRKFSANTSEFRSNSRAKIQMRGDESHTVNGWASRPQNGGFLQISMSGWEAQERHLVGLYAVKTGKTPASCDLWQGECE